jgi:hypothetical protein
VKLYQVLYLFKYLSISIVQKQKKTVINNQNPKKNLNLNRSKTPHKNSKNPQNSPPNPPQPPPKPPPKPQQPLISQSQPNA